MAFFKFRDFVAGHTNNPVYNHESIIPFTTLEFPNRVFFGSVRSTALVLFLLNLLNEFKEVDANEVKGFELYYLFNDNRKPENIIPIIDYYNPNKKPHFTTRKHKDLSFLLSKSNSKSNNFLITNDMKEMTKDQVLQTRKDLIKWHERNFVKKLGLVYDETQFIH